MKTGREGGGRHYYFNAPGWFRHLASSPIEGLGIAKRTAGNVEAPPSIDDKTGKLYVWKGEIGKESVTDLPDWSLALATQKRMPTPEQLDDVKTIGSTASAGTTTWRSWPTRARAAATTCSTPSRRKPEVVVAGTAVEQGRRVEGDWRMHAVRNGLAARQIFWRACRSVVQTIRSGIEDREQQPARPYES